MPKVIKPKFGQFLESNSEDIIVVIDPIWSKNQINDALRKDDYFDSETTPETHEFQVETWYYHTNHQRYSDYVGSDYDQFWSPEGLGKTFIHVAIVRF